MIEQHITRYLSYDKLCDLLVRKALWFSRIDKLGDPFEGSLPPAAAKEQLHNITQWLDLSVDASEPQLNLFPDKTPPWMRTRFACCFTAKDHECSLLWHRYCASGPGVAIRIQRAVLEKWAKNVESSACIQQVVYSACIKQIDYVDDLTSLEAAVKSEEDLCRIKRIEFASEAEVRAIVRRVDHLREDPADERFVGFHACVAALLPQIEFVLSPNSPPGYLETVQKMVETAGGDRTRVRQSSLAQTPCRFAWSANLPQARKIESVRETYRRRLPTHNECA